MRIGIDIDDTIANTFETFLKLAVEYTKKYVNPNFQTENCNTKTVTNMPYKETLGWTDEQDEKFWKTSCFSEVLLDLTIKENAKEVINKLWENNEIFIITSRNKMLGDNVEELTRTWLENNGVKYHHLYIDAEEKINICLENKIDLFIDDSYYQCKKMNDNNIKTYMMQSQANKQITDESITVVKSWNEIAENLNVFSLNNKED